MGSQKFIFRSVSSNTDEFGNYGLSDFELDKEFDLPFLIHDEETVDSMLDEIRDSFEIATGYSFTLLEATRLLSRTRFGESYLEPCQLWNSRTVDDILDIRKNVILPPVIRDENTRFFVLNCIEEEDVNDFWFVLVPYADEK